MREELTLRQKISIGVGIGGLVLLLLGIAVLLGSDTEDYFVLTDEVYYGTYQSADIKSVMLDVDYGEVVILNGAEFQLKIDDIEKDSFKMELVDNVLKISYDVSLIDSIYMSRGDGLKSRFELTLPNKMYEELLLDTFNGSLSIKGVSCNELNVSSNMSDTVFEKTTVNQKVDIDASACDLSVDSCTFYSPNISCGSGYSHIMKSTLNNLRLDGSFGDVNIASCLLSGDARIDGGAGDMSILLLGNKDSYGFSFLKGSKKVTVAGESFKKYDDTAAENNILVNAGRGEISFKFYQ